MGRRGLLQASLMGGMLAGCSTAPGGSSFEAAPPLVPIRARTDRIFDIAVCLRPFRPAGPRVDTERVGDTLVVHNYGHGGSGWSLSWGSSARAVRLAPTNLELLAFYGLHGLWNNNPRDGLRWADSAIALDATYELARDAAAHMLLLHQLIVLTPHSVIDLTGKMAADGSLTCATCHREHIVTDQVLDGPKEWKNQIEAHQISPSASCSK
jgi:hypothetical protein